MLTVAITGASGFIGQHLLRQLQALSTGTVKSIVTIDRKELPNDYLDTPKTIETRHVQIDLNDEKQLREALRGVDVVFHLAAKRMQLLFDPLNEAQYAEQYVKDNIDATETLVDSMIAESVPYLIYSGDAYANLPAEDNFGLSEDNHSGVPKSFLLEEYGETRIRAELYARKHVGTRLKNGKAKLCGVFLRPVHVYGEGDQRVLTALLAVAKHKEGIIPTFEGASRSMFQYIYAGNYAELLLQSMRTLIDEPQKCNGEYMYCMEDTVSSKFSDFYQPFLKANGASFTLPEYSYYAAWIRSCINQWLARRGWSDYSTKNVELTTTAMRFFLGYAYGFSNRKQTLTINWNPSITTAEAVKRSTKWSTLMFKGILEPQKINTIEREKKLKISDEYVSSKLDRYDVSRRDDKILRMG